MLPPRSPKRFFISKSAPESYEQITKYVLGHKVPKCFFWEKPYITLVVTSKIKPYRVYVVWVIMLYEQKAHILHNSFT